MTVRRTMSGDTSRVGLASELALALVESSADGILVVDRGVIVYANQRAEQMFGYPEGGLADLAIEELVPESVRRDHLRRRRDFEQGARARPMGMGLDLIARRSDGSTFFADISLTPLELGTSGSDGDGVGSEGPATPSNRRVVVASVRDVTDRVEAESRMYEVLSSLDAAEDALYVFDDTTLAISFVNQGAVRQLGYDTHELKAMTPLHFCPEFDHDSLLEMLAPLQDPDVPSCAYRTVHRSRSGRDLAVQVVAQWIPTRSGGGHFVALARDISEHAAIESNLVRAREILDKLGEGVVIHREDDLRIEYVNQGYCDLLGLRPADLVGLTPEHIPGLDAAAFRAKVASLADGTRRWATYEREMTDGSGRVRMCEVHLQALRPGPDLPRSIVALVRDVTDRRESEARARTAERELDLMTDRERIARDLHDSVIQRLFATGMSLQVASRRIADVAPELGERIEGAVTDLDQTITEIRSAIFGLRATDVWGTSLRSEIEKVVRESERILGFPPGVELAGPVDAVPPELAEALIPTLREALSNVARHADATQVEVLLSVGSAVELRVLDNGCGIPERSTGWGNGLRNMAARAADRGGTCEVSRRFAGGTEVNWKVPVGR